MIRMIATFLITTLALTQNATASQNSAKGKADDYLVKLTVTSEGVSNLVQSLNEDGISAEKLSDNWIRIQLPQKNQAKLVLAALNEDPNVEYIQPNYPVAFPEDYRIQDPLRRAAFIRGIKKLLPERAAIPDNLPIPTSPPPQQSGPDTLFTQQWGMLDVGVRDAWKMGASQQNMIVAVIDTGVDYTHEDLLPNLWRNSGEMGFDNNGKPKESNGIDDDANGYIDDLIGWDFKSNDNKPYDLTTPWQELLSSGGNPGHGTHCAGNVGARGDNVIGVAGVAPNVKIMSLRFLGEKGGGTTADAIKAIKYAVDNGAKILSNSWGSEGEDPNEGAENRALRDIIQYAQDHEVLFIAAAGNGHKGKGYDNDNDPRPAYPASYGHENIISVAALNSSNRLGGFSNWGAKSVDIGAPGVAVFSTTVGSKYSDKVLEVGGFEVTWDGTSMATPHVAGAAALYWATNPEKSWQDVKNAILKSAKKIPALSGKVTSQGKLDVIELMKQ